MTPVGRVLWRANVFLVTSTIRATTRPLSYSSTRSVYSAEERLSQTLRTIQSVREKAPNSAIVLLENSDLAAGETETLQHLVDWFVPFALDPVSRRLRDGPYKGAAELYMLVALEQLLRPFSYERIFKLSGRYWLSDDFCLDEFPRGQFGFLSRDSARSTRLYSVPKRLERMYFDELRRVLRLADRGKTIEAEILRRVPAHEIVSMPRLGVCGYLAVNGEFLQE